MEFIEFKLKGIDGEFITVYTKNIIELLGEPEVSAVVDEDERSEQVLKLLQSLGYSVESKKIGADSVRLLAKKG